MEKRREFIKKVALGTAGMTLAGATQGMSARSYAKIMGANDRIHIGIAGLGRRVGAYHNPIGLKSSNVELVYLCDVMKSQREKAGKNFARYIDYTPKLENDIRKVIEDPKVDVLFNATPDHWHAPGTWMAVKAGKHVYVEKPCSHNPREGELLVEFQKKYNKVIQMGNQQRSSPESQEIIRDIHNGVIGQPYQAIAFYATVRNAIPVQKKAPVPEGLDWELWQGPAPHREYTSETWDYNWHWYGWNYGTAEAGNNGTHEIDIARWAMQGDYPERVEVKADRRYFPNDGFEVYDTMEATYQFPGNKIIQWQGQSRNGYTTYGSDRGTLVFGTEGNVYIDRGGYKLYDRTGKLIRSNDGKSNESSTALGGGGDMTTRHVVNFFDAVRGTAKLHSPIDEGVKSVHLCHLANIAYRSGQSLDVDSKTGKIMDKKAMKYWDREYQPGWEPKL